MRAPTCTPSLPHHGPVRHRHPLLAATVPVSARSGQISTLVKLVRVLLWGPIAVLERDAGKNAAPLSLVRSATNVGGWCYGRYCELGT
jgi:hypothetical protein